MDREEFMDIVYSELELDPDNNRANRIIEAADEYAERRVDDALQVMEELQSVQPEIIRCKNCKHHWTHKCMDSMPIERCDLEQTFYDAEHDFCSFAERRTDG